jgi:HIRAN domain
VRHFFAQVAGESHRNDEDGSDRQAIIASCRVGELLFLDAEPDNPEDENAVRVLRRDGKQIGYLERAMAARIVDDLSDFTPFVAGIGRGGTGPYLGVALLMVVNDGQDAAVVEAYARRTLEAEGNFGRSAPEARSIEGRWSLRRRRPRRPRSTSSHRASPLRWALLTITGIAVGAAAVWWAVTSP